MKRVIAMLLAVVLCFGLCACGSSGSEESEKTPEDAVRSAVRGQIMARIILSYETTGVPNITMFVSEDGDNTYEVTGKVTVQDKYGDSYTGKYDAMVEYDPETGDCDVDLSLGDLYKN